MTTLISRQLPEGTHVLSLGRLQVEVEVASDRTSSPERTVKVLSYGLKPRGGAPSQTETPELRKFMRENRIQKGHVLFLVGLSLPDLEGKRLTCEQWHRISGVRVKNLSSKKSLADALLRYCAPHMEIRQKANGYELSVRPSWDYQSDQEEVQPTARQAWHELVDHGPLGFSDMCELLIRRRGRSESACDLAFVYGTSSAPVMPSESWSPHDPEGPAEYQALACDGLVCPEIAAFLAGRSESPYRVRSLLDIEALRLKERNGLQCHVLASGGGNVNGVTRRLIADLFPEGRGAPRPGVMHSPLNASLRDRDGRQLRTSDAMTRAGWVMLAHNPWSPEHLAIVCAGLSAIGTVAALRFVLHCIQGGDVKGCENREGQPSLLVEAMEVSQHEYLPTFGGRELILPTAAVFPLTGLADGEGPWGIGVKPY